MPDLYLHLPKIQFGEVTNAEAGSDLSRRDLYLPVHNMRPVQIELISVFSLPDQWTGRVGSLLAYNDDSVGSLRALSQLKLESGTRSMVGLDLVRRRVAFEQRDFDSVNWPALHEAMRNAQSPAVSIDSLEGAKKGAAFFRDFMTERLDAPVPSGGAPRVMIIVGSSRLFATGSDLHPLRLQGDCHCRVYYLHLRLNPLDAFDDVRSLIKPLHPRTFDLTTADEMRQALARIVHDLESLY